MLQNNPALKNKKLRRPYLNACNNIGLFSNNHEKTD